MKFSTTFTLAALMFMSSGTDARIGGNQRKLHGHSHSHGHDHGQSKGKKCDPDIAGPPYSIPHDDVRTLFAATCSVEVLEREDRLHVEPVWKDRGCTEFYETSYLLIKNETVV